MNKSIQDTLKILFYRSFTAVILIIVSLLSIGCSSGNPEISAIADSGIHAKNHETYYPESKLKKSGMMISGKEHGKWILKHNKGNIIATLNYHLGKVIHISGNGNPSYGRFDSITADHATVGKNGLPVLYSGNVKIYRKDTLWLGCDSLFRPENHYDSIIIPGKFEMIFENEFLSGEGLYSHKEFSSYIMYNLKSIIDNGNN